MAQRVIAGDDFAALYAKFNSNADTQPAGLAVSPNGMIELSSDLTAPLFTYPSGGAKGFVLEGLTVTFVTGFSEAIVEVLGGFYAWQNLRYSHPTTNYGLAAPDLFNPRIDVIRANQNGVTVLTGTPDVHPQAPDPNGIPLAYITVYPNGQTSLLFSPEKLEDVPFYINAETATIPDRRNVVVVLNANELTMPNPYDGQKIFFSKRMAGTFDLVSDYKFNGATGAFTVSIPSRVLIFSAEHGEWIVL